MIYSILIAAAWLLILALGLAWCIANLISAHSEERRTRPEPTVDYEDLRRAAEVAEMLEICREAAV